MIKYCVQGKRFAEDEWQDMLWCLGNGGFLEARGNYRDNIYMRILRLVDGEEPKVIYEYEPKHEINKVNLLESLVCSVIMLAVFGFLS